MEWNNGKNLTKKELEVIYNVKCLYNQKISESNLLINSLNKKNNLNNDDKTIMITRICAYIKVNNEFEKSMQVLNKFSNNTNEFYNEIIKRINNKFKDIDQKIATMDMR